MKHPDYARSEPRADPLQAKDVQEIVPGQPFEHAKEDPLRVQVSYPGALPNDDLEEFPGIHIVVPDRMLHDRPNRVTAPNATHDEAPK